MRKVFCAAVIISLPLVCGCGESFEMEVAPVSGTVACMGNPITEGYIVFTPVVTAGEDKMDSGKSAYATISSDGTYTLTTYDDGDGAVIGMHEVRVYKPDPEDDEQIVRNPFACGRGVLEIEVKAEDNVIHLDPGSVR